jgi:hypothetical protein
VDFPVKNMKTQKKFIRLHVEPGRVDGAVAGITGATIAAISVECDDTSVGPLRTVVPARSG